MNPAGVALTLITLHAPAGHAIDVNPAEIVSLREAQAADDLLAKGAQCVVLTTDGKFLAVVETCAQVREMYLEPPAGP